MKTAGWFHHVPEEKPIPQNLSTSFVDLFHRHQLVSPVYTFSFGRYFAKVVPSAFSIKLLIQHLILAGFTRKNMIATTRLATRLCLLVVFSLTIAVGAFAQSQATTGNIEGRVLDPKTLLSRELP